MPICSAISRLLPTRRARPSITPRAGWCRTDAFPAAKDQPGRLPCGTPYASTSRPTAYDVAHLFGGIQVYEYAHAVEPLPALITPYESYSLYLRRVVEQCRCTWKRTGARAPAKTHHPDEAAASVADRTQLRIVDVRALPPRDRRLGRDREELLALVRQLPVEVIPNGVDLDYFQPNDCAARAEHADFHGQLRVRAQRRCGAAAGARYFPANPRPNSRCETVDRRQRAAARTASVGGRCDHRHGTRPRYARLSQPGDDIRLTAAAGRGHQEQDSGSAGAGLPGRCNAAERRWHCRAGQR